MTAPVKIYRRSELEAIAPGPDVEGCLARFKAVWIDGVDDTSDPALLGICFAAIQHRYVVLLVDNQVGQDRDFAESAFVDGVAATQLPGRLLPEMRQLWFHHAETFELPLDRFVAAEERGAVGDVGFTPDLVLAHPERNSLEVVDQKSGYHPPLTEVQVKGLFQARVYSAYARQRWPNFSTYEFTIEAVRFKKKTTVSFTNEELDQVELEVRAAIATIEDAHKTGKWPATPGPSCHFCELECPVANQPQTLPKRVINPEFAVQLAGWVNVAQKQVTQAKKLLKGYVVANGPLVANGLVWENRPSESESYPLDKVIDALHMAGVAGAFDNAEQQGLMITKSSLAKVFKAYPMLEEALRPSKKTKTTYRFSGRNPELPAHLEGDEE